jgi:hypothetical protein
MKKHLSYSLLIIFLAMSFIGCRSQKKLAKALADPFQVKTASSINTSITPNPNNGKFLLSINDEQSNSQREIFIYNSLGQVVCQQVLNSTACEVDLSSQSKGIYFVKVQSVDKVYTKKS